MAALAIFTALFAPPSATWAAKQIDGVVNLNTATEAELQLVPGIGPAKVRAIVEYRQAHPFRTVDEIVRIKGIGRKMLRKIRAHLTVSGPTTARPGAGGGAQGAGAHANR